MQKIPEEPIYNKIKKFHQIAAFTQSVKRQTNFFSLSFLVFLCLVGYQHALNGNFVFDDIVAIVKNKDVTTLPLNLSAIYAHDFWGAPLIEKDSHKSYRPMTILMFHLEYAHLNLLSKHMKLINLFLHCLNTCLVWILISSKAIGFLNRNRQHEVALIASSLFAVHPVHTEAVCGVVGRADLMFCICYLLVLLLASTRKVENKMVASDFLIVMIAFIGLLFKESAITILPTCIFFDILRQKYFVPTTFLQQLQILLSWKNILWMSSTLAFLLWRLWLQNFEDPKFKAMDNPIAYSENCWAKVLSQNFLYALNIWILLCPQWLSFDWALGCVELIDNFADLRVLSIIMLYTFACLMLWTGRNNNSILIFCLGITVIPFLPASGIIKVGFVIAERTLYVPSIGFCLLIAHSFVHLRNFIQIPSLCLLHKSLLMLVLVCFLMRTRERATEWMTEEKLFSSALAVCPKNAKVHYNIARLATDKFDRRKAFRHYHKAIELYPQYESALMNLGNLYREIGDLHTAEKYLKAALESLTEFPAAWMNLGIVQSARKNHAEALISYQNALKYRKRYAICHYNMGNLYLDLNKYSEAMQHWQEAISLNPKQPKAWINILTMLDNRGLYEDAVRLSQRALEHLPNETGIMFIRANVFGKLGQYIESESLYKLVIAMEPSNMLYHTNLGVLYHRWGKVNLAIESYQRAFKLDPKKAITAQENLSKLLFRRREEDKQEKAKAS